MSIHRSHQHLLGELRDLGERATPAGVARSAPAVSSWSVGQHLEHLVLTGESILAGLSRLDAEPSNRGPSALGRLILFTGWIPRGRGKAPAIVVPSGCELTALAARLAVVAAQVAALEPQLESLARARKTIMHPLLGPFRPHQWIRFASVHNRHHLAIIRDIERSSR